MYTISIILDDERYRRIKGTELEGAVKGLFGGALKVIELEVSEEQAKKILSAFPRARIDARGHIEETPVCFRRELFNILVKEGKRALDEILKDENLNRIKEMAAKEDEYLEPP